MPGCGAPNCTNNTKKGVRLFRLPRGPANKERREQWIRNINRRDLPDQASICEKHFTEDQFELNRQDKRKLLRWNAVPTLFSKDEGQPSKRKKLIEKEKEKLVLTKVSDASDPNNPKDIFVILKVNEPKKEFEENPSVDKENGIEETSITDSKALTRSNEPVVEELTRKLQQAQEEIEELKEKLQSFEDSLKIVFGEDQINILKQTRGKTWHIETIKKSLKLYVLCGTVGYEELLRQNYPLPSARTLQRRIQGIKSGNLEELFTLLEVRANKIKQPEGKVGTLLPEEINLKYEVESDDSSEETIDKPKIAASSDREKIEMECGT